MIPLRQGLAKASFGDKPPVPRLLEDLSSEAPQERRRMIATGIPLRDLHLAWPDLWPLLEPAVRRTPDKPDVLARLIARDAQLWAVYDEDEAVAAIVTQITLLRPCAASEALPSKLPRKRKRVPAMAGRREPPAGVGGRLPLQARALGALAGLRRALGIRP